MSSEMCQFSIFWEVIANGVADGLSFDSILSLRHEGGDALGQNWALYFNFTRPIKPESLPPYVHLQHLNGDFWVLRPTPSFQGLAAGEALHLPFQAKFWAIKTSDAPTGFYLVLDEGAPHQTLIPVQSIEIAPFIRPEQRQRSATDHLPDVSPASHFQWNARLSVLPLGDLVPIIPSPTSFIQSNDFFELKPYIKGVFNPRLEREWGYLKASFEKLGIDLVPCPSGEIPALCLEINAETPTEGYSLSISPQSICIKASTAAGVFYGIQSLLALVPPSGWQQGAPFKVPACEVEDAPQFAYRGLHLDVARNFHPLETVYEVMDWMAAYKLNKLHLHLTDDEGWRIEIDGLPELTEVGVRKGHIADQQDFLVPSYGSGAYESVAGAGFYTAADYLALLLYAKTRHIEIIPELDFPGHAKAAIQAMEVRYQRLKSTDQAEKATEFLLSDLADTSEYQSVQMWRKNVVNVCLSSTYHFIAHVVTVLQALHEQAGLPLHILHIGGDEVPHGTWQGAPCCQPFMPSTAPDWAKTLMQYFVKRVQTLLAAKGIQTAGWEEVGLKGEEGGKAEPDPTFIGTGLQTYVWNTLVGSGAEESAYKLANAGFPVVLCNAPNLYFDFAYDKSPEEAGLYWGGFIETETVLQFAPFNVYALANQTSMGDSVDPDLHYQHAIHLTAFGKNQIQGIQAQLWSECLPTKERLAYMALPRLLALAERAWAASPPWASLPNFSAREQAARTEWNVFANRLGRIALSRLSARFPRASYRVPPPAFKIEDDMVWVNAALIGLRVHYTTSGEVPSLQDAIYQSPLPYHPQLRLRAFDEAGHGSRWVSVTKE